MKNISIIYAYRNREVQRLKLSFQSLELQSYIPFDVQFIDYGSEPNFSDKARQICDQFSFVNYYYIGHQGLLWNKSKALNYGIANTEADYILIADIDVVFEKTFLEKSIKNIGLNEYMLYEIAYLKKGAKIKLNALDSLVPKSRNQTFGVGLFPTVTLKNIGGLDPFFHFYGSEDEELNARLKASGLKEILFKEARVWHIWHPRYPQKKAEALTKTPRLSNVLRLNQRHFQKSKASGLKRHHDYRLWTLVVRTKALEDLMDPDISLQVLAIRSHVDHLLNVELEQYQGKVVHLTFVKDETVTDTKFKIKKMLGRITQPRVTLKWVNDRILEKIVNVYRHYNYAYEVDLVGERLIFTIDLKSLSNA